MVYHKHFSVLWRTLLTMILKCLKITHCIEQNIKTLLLLVGLFLFKWNLHRSFIYGSDKVLTVLSGSFDHHILITYSFFLFFWLFLLFLLDGCCLLISLNVSFIVFLFPAMSLFPPSYFFLFDCFALTWKEDLPDISRVCSCALLLKRKALKCWLESVCR